MPAGARDHRGVVGVESWTRDRDSRETVEALGGPGRQCPAACDATAEDGSGVAGGTHRALEFGHEHVEHRVLKPTREVRAVALQIIRGAHGMQDRRLQSGERELESVRDHGSREVEARRISFAREFLDRGPAGIPEPQQRRHLIEGLARGVIARLPQQPVAAPGGHVEQQGVASRNEQRHERRREIAIFDRRREEVPFHVVHADEVAIAGKCERLGVDDADEQRPGEPGPGRYRDRIDRRGREACFRERAVDDGRESREVRPARQLGHDAAEDLVNVLRQNDETRQLAVHQNGGRRFVARRLDAEDGVSHDGAGLEAWRGAAA